MQTLIDMGANFNLYMFHGGTNFNFYAGANHFTKYLPTVTSYDYATLLNEYGDYTPTYMKVRSILLKAQNIEETPLIASPKLQNVGAVKLTEQANLFDNLDNIGTKYYTAYPESMEKFDQNFGYVLYRTDLKGEYNNRMLFIEGIHDIAYLYVDGIFKKKFDRCKNKSCKMSCFLGNFSGSKRIEIFVEGMGRINYGIYLEDRKGVERIRLASQILFGWEQYSLPMDNLEKLQFTPINKLFDKPTFYKGHFKAKTDADCFVDMNGFSKGFVVVNGFNIGRYWKKGPQRTLYLPAPILKEYNEIIVFEQEGIKKPMLKIIDTHLLGR